jgi:hypothetical protein
MRFDPFFVELSCAVRYRRLHHLLPEVSPQTGFTKMLSFHMHMMRPTLAVLMFALVSGCTTTTTGNWEDPRTKNAPDTNLLVVAFANHDSSRATLERQVTRSISGNSSSGASASTSLVTKLKDAPRDRESILTMSRKINADAVLLLQMEDSSVKLGKSKKEKDKYLFSGPEGKNMATSDEKGSWQTPHITNETDILPDTKINVEIQATLYDLADNGRAVYTIDVKTKYKEKGGELIYSLSHNIAEGVSNKLRQEGLIK